MKGKKNIMANIKELLGNINFNAGALGGISFIGQSTRSMPQDLASGWDYAFEGFTGSSFNPIIILGAKITNGINYYVIAEQTVITAEPQKKIAIVEINIPAGSVGGKGASLVSITNSDNANIPENIKLLLDQATSKLLGNRSAGIMYIGYQIVSGMMFYIIGESQVVRPGSMPYPVLMKLWVKPNGETEISMERIPKR